MTSLEISILKSFKNTTLWQNLDATMLFEPAIRLTSQGFLERRVVYKIDGGERYRFRLTEKGKEVCDKWGGE